MLSVRTCARGLNLVVLLLCVESTDPLLLGESVSPFIDEGNGLTSESESVRMLSLIAHAVGYKMILGAHNIVDV